MPRWACYGAPAGLSGSLRCARAIASATLWLSLCVHQGASCALPVGHRGVLCLAYFVRLVGLPSACPVGQLVRCSAIPSAIPSMH